MPPNMTKEVSFPSIIVIRKLEGNVNMEKLLHKRHLKFFRIESKTIF